MIGQNNMPYASGFMSQAGLATMSTELKIIAQYQIGTVPYIVPQEEGFYHWRSGQFIDKNQHFIRERTVGAWNTYIAEINAGVKPNMQKETEQAQRRASPRLLGAGVIRKLGG
jgi:hypothetical protein